MHALVAYLARVADGEPLLHDAHGPGLHGVVSPLLQALRVWLTPPAPAAVEVVVATYQQGYSLLLRSTRPNFRVYAHPAPGLSRFFVCKRGARTHIITTAPAAGEALQTRFVFYARTKPLPGDVCVVQTESQSPASVTLEVLPAGDDRLVALS